MNLRDIISKLPTIYNHWLNEEGYLHREDGPAVEFSNGSKEWYINGKKHRTDGPAVDYINGYKVWYYYGEPIDCETQEEFERIIKLKGFW